MCAIKLKNQTEFKLESLGRFEFKNVEEGMTVYALSNEGFIGTETVGNKRETKRK